MIFDGNDDDDNTDYPDDYPGPWGDRGSRGPEPKVKPRRHHARKPRRVPDGWGRMITPPSPKIDLSLPDPDLDHSTLTEAPQPRVKMRQILAAQFQSAGGGLTYSLFGLGRDGIVYRYDPQCVSWIPWPDEVSDEACRLRHLKKR